MHSNHGLNPPPHRHHFIRLGHTPTVSVIVPAMNEEANLPWVLEHMPPVHEVIVVDGHSTDRTVEVAESYGARVVQQLARGKGAALATGFLAATGDIVVMIDADGSMDPADIYGLVGALLAGADVAKGSRYLAGAGSTDFSLIRDAGNRGLKVLSGMMFRTGWSELCYGLAAFWADMIPDLRLEEILLTTQPSDKSAYGRGFEIETLLFTRAHSLGMKVVEVPSFEYPRLSGDSNLSAIPDGFRVLWSLLHEHGRKSAPPKQPSIEVRSRDIRERVGVVITAHDGKRLNTLLDCHAAVTSGQRLPDELVVVVDRNPELARALENTDGWTVLENTQAAGLSGARNTAIQHLSEHVDIVAFLDDDAIPHVDWLHHLVTPLEGNAVEGAMMSSGHASAVWPQERKPLWFPDTFLWVVGCSWEGLPKETALIRNPLGATMAIRMEVFDQVGLFPEDMGRVGSSPVGCEETELAIRAARHLDDMKVVFVPQSKVQQVLDDNRDSFRYFLKRTRAEGRSKAVLSERHGSDSSLSEERKHLINLAVGMVRDLHVNPSRAGASFIGLASTSFGFAEGKWLRKTDSRDSHADESARQV